MGRLEPFVGEWEMEATFPGAPPVGGARTTFKGRLLDHATCEKDFELKYTKR